MVQRNRQYKDLDLDFNAHPVTGDINILTEDAAVKRSVRNLVLTGYYQRFFRPGLGSGVSQLLFEPISPISERRIATAITDTLNSYEPRIQLIDVDVNADIDNNRYEANITFYIINLIEPIKLTVFLERVR